MDKKNERQIRQELFNENKISKLDLLQEIEPLLKDYFIGDISIGKSAITYILQNGQIFNITATEII
jgi:hypothetical protein